MVKILKFNGFKFSYFLSLILIKFINQFKSRFLIVFIKTIKKRKMTLDTTVFQSREKTMVLKLMLPATLEQTRLKHLVEPFHEQHFFGASILRNLVVLCVRQQPLLRVHETDH